MSFFKKMLSKVGIGAARVDTELYNEVFTPGEGVKGVVTITGGSVEQEIDAVYFKIKSTFEDEIEIDTDDGEEEVDITRSAVIESFQISEPFTLAPEEVVSFDIDFTLPPDTPATVGKTKTWVETGLDIKMAVDPGDKDYIHVLPHPLVDAVLNSLLSMGFVITEVVCEPAPPGMGMRVPFVQEFELKPDQGHFKQRLDEIELIFRVLDDGIEVFMEVDRKARGLFGHLSELMEQDESMVRFIINKGDLDNLTIQLNDLIEAHC